MPETNCRNERLHVPRHDARVAPPSGELRLRFEGMLASAAALLLAWHPGPLRALAGGGGAHLASRPSPVRCSVAPLGEGEWEVSDVGDAFYGRAAASTLRVNVAGKEMTFHTGEMARQASGAVTCVQGDTHVFCSACFEKQDEVPAIDFMPLRVDYFERKSSAGRTAGGYLKRDGRPSAHETLVSRLIDRPIRPSMGAGWSLETQLTSYVLAFDGIHPPDVMAMTAASAALAISEVPFPKPVAAVRVGLISDVEAVDGDDDDGGVELLDDDEEEDSMEEAGAEGGAATPGGSSRLVINPTREEMARSSLNLVIAGTSDAVLMVEGFCDFLPEETVLEAMELGLQAIGTLADAIEGWASECGAPKHTAGVRTPAEGVDAKVAEIVGDRIEQTLCGPTKDDRENWEGLCSEAVAALCTPGDEEDAVVYEKVDVKSAFKRLASETLRKMGVRGVRQDGRSTTEVRPIAVKMKPLPSQVHGSVLFTRGETQSLATAVVGDDSMRQRYEDLEGDKAKRFYLQYFFPPFSVGEVGRNGAPGRREVGHGNLAEKALQPSLPQEADFPYVVRVESLITESCGSSSMASVCGGCLAMLAAGVPLSKPVAGVAMGLLLDESGGGGEPIILTDILGSEDALGTMDFKVAGDADGITAFQLDIKCAGLSLPLMKKALEQAKVGRLHILGLMHEACPERLSLPPSVPRSIKRSIDSSKVGKLIGPGGSTINSIIADSGVANINVDGDAATVCITGFDDATIDAAIARIEDIAGTGGGGRANGAAPKPPPPDINVGDEFEGALIKSVVPFGLFIQLVDGVDGFCHISELSEDFIRSMDQVDLAVGDQIDIKVTQFNEAKRQYRVQPTKEIPMKPAGAAPAGGGGGRGRGRGRGR